VFARQGAWVNTRIIAETGRGRHGVGDPGTAFALLGFRPPVLIFYMGEE
jgi:tryptophan synthase beta subunit